MKHNYSHYMVTFIISSLLIISCSESVYDVSENIALDFATEQLDVLQSMNTDKDVQAFQDVTISYSTPETHNACPGMGETATIAEEFNSLARSIGLQSAVGLHNWYVEYGLKLREGFLQSEITDRLEFATLLTQSAADRAGVGQSCKIESFISFNYRAILKAQSHGLRVQAEFKADLSDNSGLTDSSFYRFFQLFNKLAICDSEVN